MNEFKILLKREFLLLKILLLIIYIALEVYYSFFISVQYDYMGFVADLNLFKYVLTKVIFLFLLVMSFNIYNHSRFLYSIYLLLIFFFYIPNAILFSFSNFPLGPFVSNVFFVSFFLITPYIRFNVLDLSISHKYKGPVLLSIAILLLIPIAIKFGSNINLKTLMLSEIYETRESFSKGLQGFLSYFYNFEAKTIIPVALVFFMIYKRYFFVALFLLILLYLFVISGNKLVYFTSMIVIFFYYVGKNYTSKLSNFFLLTIILFALFPILDNFVLNKNLFGGTFINRFFFIPALLTHFYFDFFNGNPFYFAETHFFNHFIHSPYDMPVGFLITKTYWNEPEVFANNGIVSDGFMNLGYLGIFIFSAVFALLFSLFNSFKIRREYYGIFFCYIYIILSAPFLTCFITGGIFIFILLSVFILNNKQAINT